MIALAILAAGLLILFGALIALLAVMPAKMNPTRETPVVQRHAGRVVRLRGGKIDVVA